MTNITFSFAHFGFPSRASIVKSLAGPHPRLNCFLRPFSSRAALHPFHASRTSTPYHVCFLILFTIYLSLVLLQIIRPLLMLFTIYLPLVLQVFHPFHSPSARPPTYLQIIRPFLTLFTIYLPLVLVQIFSLQILSPTDFPLIPNGLHNLPPARYPTDCPPISDGLHHLPPARPPTDCPPTDCPPTDFPPIPDGLHHCLPLVLLQIIRLQIVRPFLVLFSIHLPFVLLQIYRLSIHS